MSLGIIIITSNQANFLKYILYSLSNQTLKADKIIVVVNNSSEDYSEVINEYSDMTSLQIRKLVNVSKSYTRNMACNLLDTEIVSFLDGDCIPNLNYVENINNLFKSENTEKTLFLGHRKDTKEFKTSLLDNFVVDKKEIKPYYWQRSETFSWSMKRKFFLELGGFDENFKGWGYEDTDLAYRIHKDGGLIFKTNLLTVFHMEHRVALIDIKNDSSIRDNTIYFLKKYHNDDDCLNAVIDFAKIWGGIQAINGGIDAISFTLPRDTLENY